MGRRDRLSWGVSLAIAGLAPFALVAQTPQAAKPAVQTPPAPPHVAGPPTPALPPLGPNALKPLEGSADFISPVGEPYHSEDRVSGAEHWFATVDADHDGRITSPEYLKDADRFFARLDRDHNGEIEPAEIEIYETEIAPEIRVVSTGAQYQPGGDDGESKQKESYPDRLGAGRYSWIDLPEPVVSMDVNFDRAISRQEFLFAARKRFVALDADHNGVLTRDELPKITPPRLNPHGDDIQHKRGGGRGGHGGGGMRGGGGGGGMGGPGGGMNGDGPG